MNNSMHTREEKLAAFGRLLDIMDELREKCPWNAAQTMETIRPMTEEEVYELSDTILEKDRQGTAKEIGDLLYHMVFYARIGEEEGAFDITYDVFSRLTDENEIITTQEVRDCINEVLCERGLLETARRYADYKEECHSDQV